MKTIIVTYNFGLQDAMYNLYIYALNELNKMKVKH